MIRFFDMWREGPIINLLDCIQVASRKSIVSRWEGRERRVDALRLWAKILPPLVLIMLNYVNTPLPYLILALTIMSTGWNIFRIIFPGCNRGNWQQNQDLLFPSTVHMYQKKPLTMRTMRYVRCPKNWPSDYTALTYFLAVLPESSTLPCPLLHCYIHNANSQFSLLN